MKKEKEVSENLERLLLKKQQQNLADFEKAVNEASEKYGCTMLAKVVIVGNRLETSVVSAIRRK